MTVNLSDKIKAIRLARGLTQEEFAEMMGVTQPTITRWERGAVPNGEALHKIAKLGGGTLEQLMNLSVHFNADKSIVPVVGTVGYGGVVCIKETKMIDEVVDFIQKPSFIDDGAVALRVEGDGMLPVAENGWKVVYYDNSSIPVEEALNKLCVIELADDRLYVGRILRGFGSGMYNLLTAGVIRSENVVVRRVWPVGCIIPS